MLSEESAATRVPNSSAGAAGGDGAQPGRHSTSDSGSSGANTGRRSNGSANGAPRQEANTAVNNSSTNSTNPPQPAAAPAPPAPASSLPLPPIAAKPPTPPPPPQDVQIGRPLAVLLSFVSFVFIVVSVPIPWYQKRQYGIGPNGENYVSDFYLWRVTHKVGSVSLTTSIGDITCVPVRGRIKALEAFAIISIATSLIATILAVVYWRVQKARIPAIVAAGASVVATTVAVSMNFNIYLWSFAACGVHSSYHSLAYELYVGSGLFITAWVLSMFSGLMVVYEPSVPADARSVDICANFFAGCAFIAFLFSVISCPIPYWFYKDELNKEVTSGFLWRERYGILWAYNSTSGTGIQDFGCPEGTRYFRAAESFSIISIFFTMCSTISGYLLWKELIGTRVVSLCFAIAATISLLVHWALALRIYYREFCGGIFAYHKKQFVLGQGFGLAVAGFAVMFVGTAALITSITLAHRSFPSKKPKKTVKEVLVDLSM